MKKVLQIILVLILCVTGIGFTWIVAKGLSTPLKPSDSASDLSTEESASESFSDSLMDDSSDSSLDSSSEEYPDLEFTLLTNDSYSVKTTNRDITSVNIPETYNGKAVTVIAFQGFYDCTKLESVTIPSSIKVINSRAFHSSAIESILIPSTVKSIESQAFGNCYRLTSVVLEANIEYPPSCFASCGKLESIKFPEGMTKIPSAFLQNCVALENFVIPETVEYIGGGAFSGTKRIAETPGEYIVLDNWLVGMRGEYGQQDEIELLEIPEGTIGIIDSLFYSRVKLQAVVLPTSLKFIGDSTFDLCGALKTVYNLSSLEIEAGSEEYGGVARYAENVYTELPETSAIK